MRGCQFIHLFLEECANQDRSDAIGSQWDNLNKALRTRCMDKVTCVRSNAVAALSKMQQPKDPDCTAVAGKISIKYLFVGNLCSLCIFSHNVFNAPRSKLGGSKPVRLFNFVDQKDFRDILGALSR